MTSSENLASIAAYEPWTLQWTAAHADSWLTPTEAFARDAETLTRALQKTISGDTNNYDKFLISSDAISSVYRAEHQHTPSASSVSGSDPDMAATTAPRRRVAVTPTATKKITKRKPRATKKCQTTFIMADTANFRQMVQQMTGVQQLIVKPEPKRLSGTGFSLPTMGTSSFSFNHRLSTQQHQQEECIGGGQASVTADDPSAHVAFADSLIDGQGHGC